VKRFARHPRVSAGGFGAIVLLVVYVLTLAPDVTFWDAGEFIAAAHSLGIPHPPGTPLYVLLLNVWATVMPFPYAAATNLFSAVATAAAAAITAQLVHRSTQSGVMAFAAAVTAGGMSSVWLNATETEVYAASLALGVVMIWSADRAGREVGQSERWTCLTAYLIALSVPLHLSALVAAPAAIVLAAYASDGIRWHRALILGGAFVFAMGVGRMSQWTTAAGVVVMLGSIALPSWPASSVPFRLRHASAVLVVAVFGVSALAFLYVRAQFDPAIDQGTPDTLASLADMVARRQYAVSPMWPREAPLWVQFGNLGQYADWQIALSLGPTVMPSMLRTLFTVVFLVLGYHGALAHWAADRRSCIAVAVLLACGALGVLAYLNLHAGPSIGYGILPANAVREARERDYFFVFAFWAWGVWAGIGAVAFASHFSRPAWTGALFACLPIVLNWRAVTRRVEPELSLPRALAEALLESTPRDGVLFVVGDNDSYPLWYAQQVRRVRPDVAVVTIPLLPTRWYRAQIAKRFGLLTEAEIERFDGRTETALAIANGARRLGRPVAAALTLLPRERERFGESWTVGGLAYVEGSGVSGLGFGSTPHTPHPTPAHVDTALAKRWAGWVDERLPKRETRPAIDPVHSYFRRLLDCPRQWVTSQSADSTRLDSVCNYR
jgi:hypothetical protein